MRFAFTHLKKSELITKQIMNEQELKQNGFIFQSNAILDDDGSYYKWWILEIRDIAIYYTREYNEQNEMILSYWELNGHKLKNPTKDDILTLIRILNN